MSMTMKCIRFTSFVLLFAMSILFLDSGEATAKKERYDIIYILTKDLNRVLDYKEELEMIFDEKVRKKLKIVGRGDEYALIHDGNDTARTVARSLILQAELLSEAGYDEPYATKDQDFHSLFNISYGMGRNFEPLKKTYKTVYNKLKEDEKDNLFIEKTDFGNYKLIYRYRGDEISANKVARQHAQILRSKKISTSLARENNYDIVYGESSLFNDDVPVKKDVNLASEVSDQGETEDGAEVKSIAATKEKSIALRLAGNAAFEQSIEKYIDGLRRNGKILKDESTGWMVYDLANDRSLVDINADREFQAASMIKPFVALAFLHQVKHGKFKYGPKSRRKLEAMIQRSSNSATNWVMKQAGGPNECDAILKKNYGNIFRKTEIKEYIPAGGRTYLNSAPPSDYVRFLRALWNKQLPYGKEIRRLMALPGRDRLYHGTPIPRGTLVYNKTGSTAHLCGDMGILVPKTKRGGRYPYVVVGIIERRSRPSNYGQWMDSRSRVIREVSTLVYEQMKKEHQLL